MKQRRAMTSDHARHVKIKGHLNEQHFAEAIGGEVNAGSQSDKKDVIDKNHRAHSVKSGKWWQIFLYGEERLRTNTIFRGIGNLADIMLQCINTYPDNYEKYNKNKKTVKEELRPHMRELCEELKKTNILKAFLDKALFDGGNADYLSIHNGPSGTQKENKHFHIFYKDDVTKVLIEDIRVINSKARQKSQTSDQKVVFPSKYFKKQIGEIEDRHDSNTHYRQIKFRLNGFLVFELLKNKISDSKEIKFNVTTYGKAIKLFN